MQQSTNIKEVVHQLIDQLPDDASWDKVIHAIQVRHEIEEGMADIEAGRVIEGRKVMEWLESWGTENEKEPPSV